jgi:vacuolar-type H+-ATPase subunit E/Vma4
METEMVRVVQSDDAAWEMVEAAKAEAERITTEARRMALKIIGDNEGELASALVAERDKILSDARTKAGDILREADLYIERMRDKEAAIHQRLIAQLSRKVTTA